MYQSIPELPIPPAGQTPGHLTFLKNVGQLPRYVASLDGQMPHPLELQRGSNPPPSRHVKATVLNFFSCVKPFIQMYVFWQSQPQRLNLSQVFLFLMRIKFNEYKRCMSSLVIFYAFYMSYKLFNIFLPAINNLYICSSFPQIEGDSLTIDQHRKAVVVLRLTFTYQKKLIQRIIYNVNKDDRQKTEKL